MLGDTKRLLSEFRKNGYHVRETEDSRGNTCWDIYYPVIHHDFGANPNNLANQRNRAGLRYVGKVERFPEGPRTYFGRPYFYYTWQRNLQGGINKYVKDAVKIAETTKRATVRKQI